MIFEAVCKSKQGDKDAMLGLVERFDPLLRKYSRKLGTEDGYSDMLLDFLEKINSMHTDAIVCRDDGAMVNYFAKAVRHSYVKLLSRQLKNSATTVSIDLVPEHLSTCSCTEPAQSYTFDLPDDLLSQREKKILYLIDVLGYSASEIAKRDKTSRQNISQIHNRAVKKLKNYLECTDQL